MAIITSPLTGTNPSPSYTCASCGLSLPVGEAWAVMVDGDPKAWPLHESCAKKKEAALRADA